VTEAQVRKWLEARMKVAEVPEILWELLKEANYVGPACDGEEGAKADLEAAAKRYMPHLSPGSLTQIGGTGRHAATRGAAKRAALALPTNEEARAKAVADYVARLAECSRNRAGHRQDDVQAYRDEFLGGRTIRPAQARRLMASPLAALADPGDLEGLGTNLLAHEAHIVDLWTEPHDEVNGLLVEVVTLEIVRHPERRRGGRRGNPVRLRRTVTGINLVAVPPEVDPRGAVQVWQNSVLYRLGWVARRLSSRYPWHEADAAWYVLTGETPPIPPLSISTQIRRRGDFDHVRVTITAEPWLSPRSIARAYGLEQHRFLGSRGRVMAPKGIRLFAFVVSQLDSRGRLPSWRRLMREWNKRHAEARYGEVRIFERDFRRAQRVAYPYPTLSRRLTS
jgi:hypothetical protein